MSEKTTNIRDWLLYIEDDRVKAFDITGHENTEELLDLCKETVGIELFSMVAFEYEKDAVFYGEMTR